MPRPGARAMLALLALILSPAAPSLALQTPLAGTFLLVSGHGHDSPTVHATRSAAGVQGYVWPSGIENVCLDPVQVPPFCSGTGANALPVFQILTPGELGGDHYCVGYQWGPKTRSLHLRDQDIPSLPEVALGGLQGVDLWGETSNGDCLSSPGPESSWTPVLGNYEVLSRRLP